MAYRGVLEDVRTCLSDGVPDRLPVFAMCQVFDAVSAGHTFEEAENDKDLLLDCVIRGIETYDWDWAWPVVGDSVTFEPLGFDFGPRMGGRGQNPYIVSSHQHLRHHVLRHASGERDHHGSDGAKPLSRSLNQAAILHHEGDLYRVDP